jgi:hypothetical protein
MQVTLLISIPDFKSYNIKRLFSTLTDPLLAHLLLDGFAQDCIPDPEKRRIKVDLIEHLKKMSI